MEEDTVITEEKQKPAHLFKPGESGNPNGRPKGSYSLKTLIEKKLKDNPEIQEKLIADLLAKEQGLIYQMIDGKPRQNIGLDGGEEGVPLGVVILPRKDDNTLETPA